jgi:hypothetical protein
VCAKSARRWDIAEPKRELIFSFVYWGAFNWVEWMKVENMDPMTITTQRIFTMAIENIGFPLTTLEVNCLERWRNAMNVDNKGIADDRKSQPRFRLAGIAGASPAAT